MSEIDRAWVEGFLLELLRTPTEVPQGETEIQPGDPRIVRAVREVLLPEIASMEPDEVREHELGDLAARFGPEGDDGVVVQTYIVSQHANLMEDPHAARIVDGEPHGLSGPCAVGQGATQNKGPMASVFGSIRALRRDLARPVWLVVNTEGRSSHDGSARVFEDLGVRAGSGVVAFGTDLRVSLGNRGRVDVEITVRGESSHSSQPWLGSNPLEGASDAIRALRDMPAPAEHPTLGPVTAVPYQLRAHPVAPHTIPERATITVDRRLLPGERPQDAVAGIREHLASLSQVDLEVREGVSMLPAIVEEDAPVVRALLEGIERAIGRPGETFWSLNAFDAGYACARGIPTPMFGPGRRAFAGSGLVGADLVPVADCLAAASALADALGELCGPGR